MSILISSLPVRKRRYRFALTPLADAMFQLLIFFMLSSSLTPYSLLTLQSAPSESEGEALPEDTSALSADPDAGPDAPLSGAEITVWRLLEGRVAVDGQEFATDQLSELANALGQQGLRGQLVLAITATARVQDVATALSALEGAEIAGVRIIREAP
ncbi:ExbD/TolR family protein [Celeribacter ethanolicus]|uniref:Biopolymer transporter ExbD n=1 Tax=Celeribacter ethanolicus TaxID=1758178 RepID=A0A291G9I0_9RHOB|nr:biopolymer transporter ExbD [Celeribacter ethanolicus]ATG46841.1 biopolymer transporter ExbD [Celeribacter ethanolicus]